MNQKALHGERVEESKMKKSRAEVKAELMQAAEERIEALLAWSEANRGTNLSAIEAMVLEQREGLSIKLAEAVIQQQAQVLPVPGPSCLGCGQEMGYKASHPLQVTSWVGELTIERGYYYCSACQSGLFPPGRAVGATGQTLVGKRGQRSGLAEWSGG
jgi:hypothetical protein